MNSLFHSPSPLSPLLFISLMTLLTITFTHLPSFYPSTPPTLPHSQIFKVEGKYFEPKVAFHDKVLNVGTIPLSNDAMFETKLRNPGNHPAVFYVSVGDGNVGEITVSPEQGLIAPGNGGTTSDKMNAHIFLISLSLLNPWYNPCAPPPLNPAHSFHTSVVHLYCTSLIHYTFLTLSNPCIPYLPLLYP